MSTEVIEIDLRERAMLESFRRLTNIQQRTVANICKHYASNQEVRAIHDRGSLRLVADIR